MLENEIPWKTASVNKLAARNDHVGANGDDPVHRSSDALGIVGKSLPIREQ